MSNVKAVNPVLAKFLLESLGIILGKAIGLFGHEEKWRGKTGGYFCLADSNGRPLLIYAVGEITADKVARYFELCQEKARRLAENITHQSSYESRDEDHDRWGGAIRVGDYIFSFSGLPELGDEALMLTLATHRINLLYVQDAGKIAITSGNPYLFPLLAA